MNDPNGSDSAYQPNKKIRGKEKVICLVNHIQVVDQPRLKMNLFPMKQDSPCLVPTQYFVVSEINIGL